MKCTINSDTKFYICKYGIFYEIVHYNEDKTPYLCFRYKNFRNKVTWTQNCRSLGTYFRKIKKN